MGLPLATESMGKLGMSRMAAFRHAAVITVLLALCALLYYFGEVVDFAGWTSMQWEFFYGPHDIHRLLFLIPIVYAAHHFRVRGALVVTLLSFAAMLPRALLVSPYPEPFLRMVISVAIAGMIGCSAGIIRNQFERRKYLEARLTAERDRFLGMLEGIEEGVYIVGPDRTVRYTNPSMVKEFGEGIGRRCNEYLMGFDETCDALCPIERVLQGAICRREYAFLDGRTFDVITSPFVDSDGELCLLASFRNVTQRKKAEQELIEISNLKSELLSNVSHELRSPLTSIKGIVSSMLQKDIDLDDQTRDMLLSGVNEETDRLSSLVTKLLDMSKLESGVWKPDVEECGIAEIIKDAMEPQKWVNRGQTFETDIEPDLPDVCADYSQIRQVLTNLIENAANYSEDGTRIVVGARAVDGEVEVWVTDEGVGIPEEELDKIFEKFYRGAGRRHKPGGTGLGLAICQNIVQNHGGRCWAESEVGRGSTFFFTVPVADKGAKVRNQ